MRTLVETVIRRRRLVIGVIAAITLASLALLTQARMSTDLGRLFLGDDPEFSAYLELAERFGSDEFVLVGVDDPQFLSPEGQQRLRTAVEGVRRVDGVRSVTSALDAVAVRPPTPLSPSPLVPYAALAAADPERAAAIAAELAADPLAGGRLVARDGRAAAVLIELAPAGGDAHQLPARIAGIRAAFAHYPTDTVKLTGFPMMVAAVLGETQRALLLTSPLVAVVLLLVVTLLFGRLWPATISLGVAGIAVTWSLALAVLLDGRVSVMTATVPGMVLIIAFCDIVHLVSAYLLELEHAPDDEDGKATAILDACSEVGRACLFTSLTTLTGFLGLALIPVPAFRVLGVVIGFGVAVALLLAVTLVPILFHVLPRPAALHSAAGVGQRLVDRLLHGCSALALGRPRLIIAVALVATAASLWSVRDLRIETDFTKRLAADHPVSADARWFDQRFQPTQSLLLVVPCPDAPDADTLRRLGQLQRALEAEEGVAGTLSLADPLALAYRAARALAGMPPPSSTPDDPRALPADDDQLRVARALLQAADASSDRHAIARWYDAERGQLRVLVSIEESGFRGAAALGRRLADDVARAFPDRDARITGLPLLLGDFLDNIVGAQRDGLLISSLIIMVLMVIGLRSLRIGVLSMLPNLLPLIVMGGVLGALWTALDSDGIMLAFVALGVGVDDTIHVLVRYRLECDRDGSDPGRAMHRTFLFAGRGVVLTTLILTFGFLPFLSSDYFLMQLLGSMLPLCLVIALVADLLLVPAMAAVGWLRFGPTRQPDGR